GRDRRQPGQGRGRGRSRGQPGGQRVGGGPVTALTGTGKLVRLILRRDRVLLPLWILIFTGLMTSIVASFQGLFPTAAERQSYATASAADPGFTSLYGPLHGSSLGELSVWRAR